LYSFEYILYSYCMNKVLIIDDEETLRSLMKRIIALEGLDVLEAGTCKAGWKKLETQEIHVVLCDVKLPDGNGVDFVKEAKAKFPLIEFILLTAYGNIPDGVQAIKNGAFDYITKGNDNDRIIPLLFQAMDKVKANKQSAVKISDKGSYSFEDILGKSPLIKEAVKVAQKIAPTDAKPEQAKKFLPMLFMPAASVQKILLSLLTAAPSPGNCWKVNSSGIKQGLIQVL
jgi:two-component system, NtrC family, response regulator